MLSFNYQIKTQEVNYGKHKKTFPIASVLFILYFIANLVRISLNAISNIISHTESGISVFTGFLYEIPLISTILFFIPFLLMGLLSLNTSKKPTIGYIITLTLAVFVPCISISSDIIDLINIYSCLYTVSFLWIVPTFATHTSFLIALIAALAYAIIAKASKKPSKLFKIWFLFPIPFIIYFITQSIASSNSIAVAIETYMAYTPYSYTPGFGIFGTIYNERAYEETITYLIFHISVAVLLVLGVLLLTTAFFCISRQFAKVNKSLAVEEAPEITE